MGLRLRYWLSEDLIEIITLEWILPVIANEVVEAVKQLRLD